MARIFLDFGSQTDFPKRFLAQVVEGTTSHNIVGQDAIKENTVQIFGHSIISSIVKLFRKKPHENEFFIYNFFFFP